MCLDTPASITEPRGQSLAGGYVHSRAVAVRQVGAASLVFFKGAGFDFAAVALRMFASPTCTKQRA